MAGTKSATSALPPVISAAANTLPAGSQATVSVSGGATAPLLTFGIPAGAAGSNPTLAIGTVTTLAAGASATAQITGTAPTFTLNLGIPQGGAGSNATATPLGTATPQPLGTAAAGSSANAAREDHVHALPAGRLVLVGNVTVTEQTIIALAVGMKRMTLPLAGITTGDMGKLIAVPNGTATAGCEVQNVYPASNGNVSVGYYTPALGLAVTYTIPVAIYRVT